MSAMRRFAGLVGGIGMVALFFVWLAVRETVLASVSSGLAVPTLVHGFAWLVLVGGASLIAGASLTDRTRRAIGAGRNSHRAERGIDAPGAETPGEYDPTDQRPG